MRLFIGIGLPELVAEALAKSAPTLVPQSQAVRVRWTPHANMHITLSFLGQVHEARRGVIEQALATIRAPRTQVELNGIGTFERVGVLFAEVKHTPALLALAEQVIATMESCGFAREKRPYSPHVTLGRMGARTRDRLRLRSTSPDDPAFHQSFEATEFRLYQSLTLPGGAQYHVLRSFPLD
ncbi:MAG: RNA 2',3'-cyclic phosphodiesterase [Silvibacterium sp.]|nr:RNA 2',3'-cyclic phosphodiesterase [Silvibacterium sp.]